MQIKKTQNQSTVLSSAVTSGAMKVAWEYAAIFSTRLALARWTRGGDIPHTYISARPAPMRAAWYDRAQWHFQAWLEEGGFQRADPPAHAANDEGIAAAPMLPLCAVDTGADAAACVCHLPGIVAPGAAAK